MLKNDNDLISMSFALTHTKHAGIHTNSNLVCSSKQPLTVLMLV